MARKRKRRATARRRSSRRRRRSGTIRFRRVRGAVYSRNPKILSMLTRGVMDAATVVGGKAVAGFIGSKIPQLVPGTLGGVVNKVLSAVAVGFAASQFLSADRARLAVAGALAAPIESAIKAANVPLLSEGLSDDEDYYEVDMQGYPALQGYPAIGASAGVGDTEDEYAYGY